MADTLQLVSGLIKRIVANITSAGAADTGKLVQLDATGKLDTSLLPAAALVGGEDYALVAFETIAANDLINIVNDAGVAKIQKANATDMTKPPMGFASVGITVGATGTVRLGNGIISGLSALAIGSRYYLSAATPGGITITAPATTGNGVFAVGHAKSATEFSYIDDATPIELG